MMALQPPYAILLADLVLYMLVFKDRKPDLANRAKQTIRAGRYYEQN